MAAAAPLDLHGLGLGADELSAIRAHLAATRPRPEDVMPPPPHFGPAVAPIVRLAPAPEGPAGEGDAPAHPPAPLVVEAPELHQCRSVHRPR